MTEVFRQDLKLTQPVIYEQWRRDSFGHLFYLPLVPLRDQL